MAAQPAWCGFLDFRRSLLYVTLFLVALGLSGWPATAEGDGGLPIHRTNAEIMRDAALQRLSPTIEDREIKKREVDRSRLPQNPDSPAVSRWLQSASYVSTSRPRFSPAVGLTFSSVNLGEAAAEPPDTMGAAGANQFLTHVNGRLRVHEKADGAVGALDARDLDFWEPVRTQGPGNWISDPRVRYDRLTDRWFLAIIDVPANAGSLAGVSNRILVAVSDGPAITATSGWSFFYFNQDAASPPGDASCLADYPTLAVDANAVYVGANMFCGQNLADLSFSNSSAWVVRKAALLSPATPASLVLTPGAVTAFRGLINPWTIGPGPYTPHGVDSVEASAAQGYLVGVDNEFFGRLVYRVVSNPGSGAPTLGPNVFVTVPATQFPRDVAVPGGGFPLDGLDDRLMNAVLRSGLIWTVHHIEVDANGVASPSGGRNALRWYAIDVAARRIAQAGTVFSSVETNPVSYWVGSIAVSGQGLVALGASAAGLSLAPAAVAMGRLASEAPGTMSAPQVYKAAEDNYVRTTGSPPARWGDYSMTSLDPCDDMSFWTIQEFAAAGNSWGTRVARLLGPPPQAPIGGTPLVVHQRRTSEVMTLTGADWYSPPDLGMSACRRPISVSIDGGVVVRHVAYVSPTQLVIEVDTTAASLGPRVVTVTNPDGQSASAAVLEVVPALSASKSVGGTFTPGGEVRYTIELRNLGILGQADNPGPELTDTLPGELSLVSATASTGAVSTDIAANTVAWDGSVPPGGTVTIEIRAFLRLGTPGGTRVANQATAHGDSDGNGTNDATVLSDDSSRPGAADATVFWTPSQFYTLAPCRAIDTRGAIGALGAPSLGPGSRSFSLLGTCGLPPDAKAVSLNATITGATQPGNLRLYPADSELPLVSTINYVPGSTRANSSIATLSLLGSIAVQCDQSGGTVDLIIDVNGYFK